jgi:lambda repressor-like predicted transcriptional regulator
MAPNKGGGIVKKGKKLAKKSQKRGVFFNTMKTALSRLQLQNT